MSKDAARGRAWLLAGAALGVGIAVHGVVRCGRDARKLPGDAVAVVGDSVISRQVLEDAVATETEGQPQRRADPEVRRRVLERLVDESLLVQGALAIGLPTRDAKVREDLAAAMRENVTGEAVSQPPDDVLRAYEQAHPAPYVRGGLLRVEALVFRGCDARDRAGAASARLQDGETAVSAGEHADAPLVPVPAGPVSVEYLARSLGPELAGALDALEAGQLTEIVKVGEDMWIARLVAREGGQLAPLDEVRASVFAAWRHQDDSRRLRRWLDQRRKETRFVVGEGLP
jgi:hypothetical protein